MLNNVVRKYPAVAPSIFLAIIILASYWRLTTMQGFIITDDIFTSDIMNEGFPYRHYISEALKNGEAPTWMPYIYGGMPLLARAEAGVCYPINLLLFGLLPPYIALNIVILLTLITAALTMYFYAREIEASIAGSVVAALAFSFSGFMVSHIKHLSMIGTVCWFPLGLLVIERALRQRDPKFLLWLSVVFGLQNLSGHIQTAYYAGLVYFVYFAFRLLSTREKSHKRKQKASASLSLPSLKPQIIWFAIAMMIAVGISAVQLIPTYELVGLTQRSGGVTFEYAASYAYGPANFKTFFYPHANGDISNATFRGKSIFWEDYGYVGLLTLLLALYAAAKNWRSWHANFFVVLAIAAYLMVLGPNTPLYEAAFHIVPGMKFFRFPTRFLFVVNAALAVLAAIGVTSLVKKKERSALSGLEIGFVLVVLADLLFFQLRQNPIVDAAKWLEKPKTVAALQEDNDLFRIYSPGASEAHKSAFAMAKGWSGDLQPYLDQREFVQASSNVLYGLSSADGYAQLTPNSVVDIWGDQNRSGLIRQTASLMPDGKFVPQGSFLKLMNLFNVKYIISSWTIVSERLLKMEENKGAIVYRNPDVMPRAFVVERYRIAATPDIAKSMLVANDFDPSSEAILYQEPSSKPTTVNGKSSARIEQYRTNEVVVSVSSPNGGVLVLSDTFYPGWEATIDGAETTIYQANVCQRAVVVPAGDHSVRFVFSSSTIRWGFWISIGSALMVVVMIVASAKKGKRE